MIQHRSWDTDYRGVLCLCAAERVDNTGVAAAATAGLDADWHTA